MVDERKKRIGKVQKRKMKGDAETVEEKVS